MDDAGFERWYLGEYPRVVAAIRVRAGDADLAEEVVAEAFVRALERWPRVGAMRSPGGWTYRVADNLLKRRLRRARFERQARQPTGAAHEDEQETDPVLWQAVQQLPPRQREAVALRYVADFSEAEVAERMGVAVGTVAATLHAARARLASVITAPSQREAQDG